MTIEVTQDRETSKWKVMVDCVKRGVCVQSISLANNMAQRVKEDMPHAELILASEISS